MTVAELIEELQKVPPHHIIFRENGEYNGDYRFVERVEYQDKLLMGLPVGVILR